jgi:hypothetical protein
VVAVAVLARMVARGWLPPTAVDAVAAYEARGRPVAEDLARILMDDVEHRDLGDDSLDVTHPAIAAEWDPVENGTLTARHVRSDSSAPVCWRCALGDRYQASSGARTRQRSCCPYCAGKRANERNSLAACRPDLVAEWDRDRNEEGPEQIPLGSHRRVHGRCHTCGYRRSTVVKQRRRPNGSGCSCCAGKVAGPRWNLAVTHPAIAAAWHPDRNGELTPDQVTPGSNKTCWWRCANDHEYAAGPVERSARKAGCPYCSGRRIGYGNDLATRRPDLARYWHATLNGSLTPMGSRSTRTNSCGGCAPGATVPTSDQSTQHQQRSRALVVGGARSRVGRSFQRADHDR